MRRLAGRKVFTVGERTYLWSDVALASHLWGEAARLERRVREGVACLKRLEASGEAPPPEIEEAADAWRYDRDLLAGDDMQAWLDERRLDLDEWLDFIRRSVLRRLWAPDLDGILRSQRPGPREVEAALYAEGVCSGALSELAERLAGRAAVHERVLSESKVRRPRGCSKAELRPLLKKLPGAVGKQGFLGLSAGEALERAEHVACATVVFEGFMDGVAAPAALRREMESHELDWTRLDCETVDFASEDGARELALIVREDGVPLGEAVAMAGARPTKTRYLIEDVEAPLKERLVGAHEGDLVGPVAVGGSYLLISVSERVLPSTKDRTVRERARERVVRRTIQREISRRVRWHERF